MILLKDSVEVMYQTHDSVEKDAAGLVPRARGHGEALFIEVSDVEGVERALKAFIAKKPGTIGLVGISAFEAYVTGLDVEVNRATAGAPLDWSALISQSRARPSAPLPQSGSWSSSTSS